MRFHHLRSATALLTLGEHRFLIDPMLAEQGTLPGFKLFGGGRRPNPLVELPEGAQEAIESATAVLITHEHPDHLDKSAIQWIRERRLPVWASSIDVGHLKKRGLDVHELRDGSLGMGVEVVAGRHGKGSVGWMMGPVSSYYLAHPAEPSVFLTGDSILTESVLEAVGRLRPDVLVAPAGVANFGAGGDILFTVDDLVTLIQRAPGDVVLNHLEALDHCPTTRAQVRERMEREGVSDRVHVPEDGESIGFERRADAESVAPGAGVVRRPGFQKWLTAKFA